jgi:hypothetical protein
MLCNLFYFPQNAIYFILSRLLIIPVYFVNHVLKFKTNPVIQSLASEIYLWDELKYKS